MTSRLNPRINYIINDGDEEKTRFEFSFPILNKQDIKVITSDGLELNSYTVTILKETVGGYIDLLQPLSVGTRITIYRDMTYNRQTIFRENEDFRASVINEEFDRIIMLLQQVGKYSKDSIRTPLSDDDMDMILPIAKKRSNTILGFDSLGRTKMYKDLAQSTLQAENFSIDAKNNADITTRNRRLVEVKYNEIYDNYVSNNLSNISNLDFKNKVMVSGVIDEIRQNYAEINLSNVSNSDFKDKATISGVSGKLATTIFTQTSGKFFVRNTDGSPPNDINTSKVWSLADQASSEDGIIPSNKNHIELPAGRVMFKVAGGGGGGGNGFFKFMGTDNGGQGGNTLISSLSIVANGGKGGTGGYTRYWGGYTGGFGSGGIVIVGGGSIGGAGGHAINRDDHPTRSETGQRGENGGLIKVIKTLSTGDIFDYIIGAGGSAGKYRGDPAGVGFAGNIGMDGYIEVDYV